MGIENVEIRVIKWESWNDKRERERERERERWYSLQLQAELLRRTKLLQLQSQIEQNCQYCQWELMTIITLLVHEKSYKPFFFLNS